MSVQKSALLGLFGVSLLWGCNYVMSAFLLRAFSPIFLSFARISMTSLFLIAVALKMKGLRRPTKHEWLLLAGVGIFGTLFNQIFYFTGLHQSTASNAALIIAMSPVATTILERIFLKVPMTLAKMAGTVCCLAGVFIIVAFAGQSLGITMGDLYLLFAMLGLSISLLFIRGLTNSMSSYAVTIFSTILGSVLMAPAAIGEDLFSHIQISHSLLAWILMGIAGIVAQGMAGFWWNRGVAVVGAGTASMFMNIPPFIALIVGHYVLGDAIHTTQIIGGILVLFGVFIANQSSFGAGNRKLNMNKSAVES
ncbi:DMT family transporter [Aneurinibacillus sp. Ricciae_BoGa-3]|uniref:DMT family transporter n=1 Tax=Aneurinibacillus sp. Ricciae_BoGa-3 TaxID=3022697 RepID=UPI00234270DD|nr:DMT family transporter [Aneurinibacillus sp. Ricciae_BoGa-3]WCK54234.1 DMT family transporter [Aneurinibacillus sp. Ricciae_BoGa-3]